MPVIKVRDNNGIVKSVPGIKVFVEGGGQGGSEPKLQDKTITENGTYSADDGYDGLGEVTVDVENSVASSSAIVSGCAIKPQILSEANQSNSLLDFDIYCAFESVSAIE